jgi:non-specific serine/threonine protein kinase
VVWYQDKFEQAVLLLEESLALFRRLANKEGTAWALIHLGDIALLQGDERQARSLAAESLAVFEEIGYRDGIIWALHGLARGAKRQGDIAQAQRLYQESLALCQALNDKLSTAICLEGLAGLAATENRPVRAARLWGAAAALCKITGAPLPPHTRTFCDHDEAAVRAQLDEATFAAVWAEGRAMTLEQAITYALGEDS